VSRKHRVIKAAEKISEVEPGFQVVKNGEEVWFVANRIGWALLERLKELRFRVAGRLRACGYRIKNPREFDRKLAEMLRG